MLKVTFWDSTIWLGLRGSQEHMFSTTALFKFSSVISPSATSVLMISISPSPERAEASALPAYPSWKVAVHSKTAWSFSLRSPCATMPVCILGDMQSISLTKESAFNLSLSPFKVHST